MSSPATDIGDYLATLGLGTLAGTGDWGIYTGEEPTAPANAITVYDTGGTMGNPDGQMYDPTFQVRVRAVSYATGYAKAAAIRDKLVLPTARSIGEWYYTGFWLISDVAKIGKDDNSRTLFTVNFRTMRELLVGPVDPTCCEDLEELDLMNWLDTDIGY